ncbi:hypothetical protein FJT64_003691 [Amphibalanus amphitrite]|uniref:Uncharacterized protein n=1 Tax=Amphibalanus amphitrite TaxID=1232801 RepID=A0A6A4VZC5_AMPAM|nr:uncharacterized protein LOC122385913 isoform X1 [Amphibalanus amphitrite]KAF0298993.1 hypothetical protein FJT64_003691 [Amphibalanus amphitrite]
MTPQLVLCCVAAVSGAALPHLFPPPLVRYAPSAVYHTQYAVPVPVSGPAAAADGTVTLVTLRNSKDSPYLLEMLAGRLEERVTPVFTRLQSVLVEAAPEFTNSKVSEVLLELRLESLADGGAGEQELQLRDPGDAVVVEAAPAEDPADAPADAVFVNSKESEALRVLRVQSLREGLTGRRPPLVSQDAIIVDAEAGSGDSEQV